MTTDRKPTDGLIVLDETHEDYCSACDAPAIFYHPETGQSLCLTCAIQPPSPYGPGYQFAGPCRVVDQWCHAYAPEPLDTRYCSLRRGHAGDVHEAWYSGDSPRNGDSPLVLWAGGVILYHNGRWMRSRR